MHARENASGRRSALEGQFVNPMYESGDGGYGQAATPTPGFGEYTMHAVDDFDGEDDESNVTVVMESAA